ncbi:MAG: family 2A encapsulin nanocompartment cargo protein cysteine desulfurase [Pseudomonadota bacterium]
MTTQIPTSDGVAGLAPPSGPIDLGALNRLAGEFFSRLPGSSGGVADGFSDSLARQAPSRAPAAVAGSVPPAAPPHYAPALGPTPGPSPVPVQAAPHAAAQPSNQQPVPAYAAALPQANRAPSVPSAPSSPYYFLGEASGYPSGAGKLDALAQQALGQGPSDDRVSAQAFGLPGADDLRRLLSGALPGVQARPAAAPQQPGQPAFYFEDHRAPQAARPQWQGHPAFDVNAIRRDFPILAERINGKPLAWFDNAATTHKPQAVIDRLAYFYAHENSNIHRAAHELAARATDAYEGARNKVARFIGAASPNEIIFVRGATEAINLVAQTFGKQFIGEGDEIIVSQLEHHANIVPWQQLATEKGAKLRVIPVDDSGQILLSEYTRLLNSRTKLVAVTQVSNALGTVTPVREIIELAHRAGVRVLVDGAQAVSHMRVDVQALDADFYVFSGHKVFGPTGIGVVYGKADLLAQLPPWQGGGNMIADVTFERTVYQDAPSRFEAGTGNIADAVGLGAALDYLDRIGMENVARYETALLDYATQHLRSIPGVRLIGTADEKASVASFVLAGYQPDEVGRALNQEGIAVRSGHHCAQPILRRFGVEATVRPSFAFYNTCEEIDRMIAVVRRLAGARR